MTPAQWSTLRSSSAATADEPADEDATADA